MAKLASQLELGRCPLCNVDQPNLVAQWRSNTTNYLGQVRRTWSAYLCTRCGGIVTAWATEENGEVRQIYPSTSEVDASVPEPARSYLLQAMNSLNSPAGAVMLSASAVDAMLKNKNYKDGNLYSRINKAAEDHLITQDMAKWAHQVRLDANDQRHADETVSLPDINDASKSIEFANALAQFIFVLPSRVTRGIEESTKK